VALTWAAWMAPCDDRADGYRKGFAAVLADGPAGGGTDGKGSERYAVQVHGREIPMNKPRSFPRPYLAYSCEPKTANHIPARGSAISNWPRIWGLSEFRG
jgi:aldehyde:ferredoxin oxidoreductase